MSEYKFDDRNIKWVQREPYKELKFSVLNVDRERKAVDILTKMDAGSVERTLLHRHGCPYHSLVLQGEHRIYNPDGTIKDVRPAGTYTVTLPDGIPHTEGVGDSGGIILFSMREVDDLVYEYLDEDMNTISTAGMEAYEELQAIQESA